jgi:hypothetical protein
MFLLAVTTAGGPMHGGPKTTAAPDHRGMFLIGSSAACIDAESSGRIWLLSEN